MRTLPLASLAAIIASVSIGCGGSGQPFVTPDRLDKGLVVVLTGVHGRLWLSDSICEGLARDGSVEQAVEVYDWTWHGKLLPFYNLGAVERNHRAARQIAEHITAYQREYPGRPVTLVGYSGGGALAIWTAEALPEGTQLDGLILLCTPLVPEYDLRPALAASRKGAVNFYSPKDRLYLAMGTLIFGTMDKHHRVSAGNVGFLAPGGPAGADLRAAGRPNDLPYRRLYQIPWQEDMARTGYDGTHLTIGAKGFIAAYVAPLVRSAEWGTATADAVAHHGDKLSGTAQ